MLFLFGMVIFAAAQQGGTNQPVLEEGFEMDSLLNTIEEEQPFSGDNPAADLYNNLWESNNIRYPQSSFNIKNDTIRIVLVGESDHDYFQPYFGKVISKFGPRSGRMHTGTDIKLNSGDSIRCAFDGKVRLARVFSGYGNMVLVRHNNGLETVYGHLKKICVHTNDTIKAGDLIGLGGRTGRATTDHLHFETRLFGEPFDSNKYIDFETGTLRSDTIFYLNKKIGIKLEDVLPKSVPQNSLAKNTTKTPTGEETVHIIKQGDNLWTLAKMYNTTVKNLCLINNITSRQILKIGTVLYVQ